MEQSSQGSSDDISIVIGFELPNASKPELKELGELVLGSPVYVNRHTKSVAATVVDRVYMDNVFYIKIGFLDKDLETNIDDKDFVVKNYEYIDTVYYIVESEIQ